MIKDKFAVEETADKIYGRQKLMKIALIIFFILFLVLSMVYLVLYVINTKGNFTISLDPNLKNEKSIIMSASKDFKEKPLTLKSDALEYMDNISETWLPTNIDEIEGEHNGNNYLAYTFFLKNEGKKKTDYRIVLNILSVIKNVDEAIRVALYTNGEKTIYAKANTSTGKKEEGTTKFKSTTQVFNTLRKDFKVKGVDKYTVVVWLEGDDPDCLDNILGGEMKMELHIGEDKLK